MKPVAVLFARADSVYKRLRGCDVWDEARDARRWPGGAPVVAHPPCRLWGRLRHMAKAPAAERELAPLAVANVRRYGGVLEHPAGSRLWDECGLPMPGAAPDEWGGWTLEAPQHWWGHRAEKLTWFYIVGCDQRHIPPVQPSLLEATHVINTKLRQGDPGYRPSVTHAEREHTPPALAEWLVDLARRCEAVTA